MGSKSWKTSRPLCACVLIPCTTIGTLPRILNPDQLQGKDAPRRREEPGMGSHDSCVQSSDSFQKYCTMNRTQPCKVKNLKPSPSRKQWHVTKDSRKIENEELNLKLKAIDGNRKVRTAEYPWLTKPWNHNPTCNHIVIVCACLPGSIECFLRLPARHSCHWSQCVFWIELRASCAHDISNVQAPVDMKTIYSVDLNTIQLHGTMICCSETASGNQSLRFPFSPLCGRRPFLSCLSNTLSFLPAASRAQNIFSASGTQLLPEFNWHRTMDKAKEKKTKTKVEDVDVDKIQSANGAPRAYHSGQIGLPKARMDKRRTCKIQTANEAAQGWGGKWTANGCWSTAKKRKKDILKRQNEGIADIDDKRLPMTHPAGSDSAPGARVCQKQKAGQKAGKGRGQNTECQWGNAGMWTKMHCPWLLVRGKEEQNDNMRAADMDEKDCLINDVRRAFHTGRTAGARVCQRQNTRRRKVAAETDCQWRTLRAPAPRRRTGLPKAKRDKRRACDVDKRQNANEATQGCGRKWTANDCWSKAKKGAP